jgi:predicted dehydrogenase
VKTGNLGIGIIGAGQIAQLAHIPGYQAISDECEIVAAADVSADALAVVQRDFGIPHVFRDYHEMLRLDSVDAVSVCASNPIHHPATLAALAAGKHVFCEKPLALNAADASEMVKAAEAANRILAVDFQTRFIPQAVALKRVIERGDLGDIYFVRAAWNRRRGLAPRTKGAFHSKALNGGGALIDVGVHVIDTVFWLMGGPRPVSVSGATYLKIGNQADGGYNPWGAWNYEEIDVDDFALALVRCDGGATISLECSWALNIVDDEYYRIWVAGDRAGAEVTLGRTEASATPLRIFTAESESWVDRVHQNFAPVPWPQHAAVADFVRAVREGRQPRSTGQDGLRVQQVVDAIYASADSGCEVRLD